MNIPFEIWVNHIFSYLKLEDIEALDEIPTFHSITKNKDIQKKICISYWNCIYNLDLLHKFKYELNTIIDDIREKKLYPNHKTDSIYKYLITNIKYLEKNINSNFLRNFKILHTYIRDNENERNFLYHVYGYYSSSYNTFMYIQKIIINYHYYHKK